jgi:hypothetical protein
MNRAPASLPCPLLDTSSYTSNPYIPSYTSSCTSSHTPQEGGADANADADVAIGEEFEGRGGAVGEEDEDGIKREVVYDELGDK